MKEGDFFPTSTEINNNYKLEGPCAALHSLPPLLLHTAGGNSFVRKKCVALQPPLGFYCIQQEGNHLFRKSVLLCNPSLRFCCIQQGGIHLFRNINGRGVLVRQVPFVSLTLHQSRMNEFSAQQMLPAIWTCPPTW